MSKAETQNQGYVTKKKKVNRELIPHPQVCDSGDSPAWLNLGLQ